MALQVWLPLNGNLDNQGLSSVTVTNNGATVNNAGKIGKCYSFTEAQYTELNNVPFSKLGNCSVCFWIYLASNESWLPCTGGSAGSNTGQYFLATQNGTGVFYHSGIGSNTTTIYRDGVVGTTPLASGAWHHYCITGLDLSSWSGLTINHYGTYSSWNFNGKLNDFRIYDHCLSPKEVKEISKGLVLHYKLDKGDILAKNLVYGIPIRGSISAGTISVAEGVATINNTSGLWCRVQCQNESASNTNLANVGVTNKTITVSFDIWMISGNVPQIFISDSYRSVTGVDKNKTGVWQRAYCTYVHPGDNSSYHYFTPHFNGVNNCKIRNLKVVLGDIQDYYSEFNEGDIVYDCSGYGRNGTITGQSISINNMSPRYKNNTLASDTSSYSIIGDNDFCLPDGPLTLSFWSKPTVSTTTDTSKIEFRFSKFYYFTYINYPCFTHDTDYRYKYTNYWSDGNWHCVTNVYDGSSLYLYIDGVLQSWTGSTTTSTGFQNELILKFRGNNLSDLRIYSTALSADDIKELYDTSAYIYNDGSIAAYEFNEINTASRELHPIPTDNPNLITHNADGSYTCSGYTWFHGDYIPINPSGKTYHYDIEYSNVAGNMFYIGFERYDANYGSGSNYGCIYIVGSTNAATRVRLTGTIALGTALTGNPTAYTKLRILNNWNNSSDTSYKGTVHYISLKEVATKTGSEVTKTGIFEGDTFIEDKDASISHTGNVIGNQIIEI